MRFTDDYLMMTTFQGHANLLIFYMRKLGIDYNFALNLAKMKTSYNFDMKLLGI